MSVKTEQREKQMLQAVLRHGNISVDELASLLGTSAASVRRDLIRLEERGLVNRTHGGAKVAGQTVYQPFRFDSTFHEREQRFPEEKRRIAMAAAELVAEREMIAFTAGTTTTQVARCIRHKAGIRVVTNAVNIGMELSMQPGLDVTLTGGNLRWAGAFSLTGPMTLESVSGFFLDKAFIGACGIDLMKGVTTIEVEEAAIFRAVVRQSKEVILVADSSKFGMVSPALICSLDRVSKIVTDDGIEPSLLASFRNAGVDVLAV
jgi:DeoR family transcriptional regulator of aga operon